MALYYVVLNANDSIRAKAEIPPGFKGKRWILSVEADDEDDARDFIKDSFGGLARVKDFGEPQLAHKTAHGWWFDLP